MRFLIMLALLCLATPVWATDIPDADSPGGALYADHCAACHFLPHPKRLDWGQWRHMLRVMKMRMDEQGMTMDKTEWRQISAYLKAHAR